MNAFFMGYIDKYMFLTAAGTGPALDCRAAGHGFDSRDRTNTQGLKLTEK